MNKIYPIAALALGLVGLTGCDDFLDQTSESEMNTETVFNSVYYAGLRVNKLYGLMGQDQTYSQVIPIVSSTNSDCELVDGLGSNATASSERGVMNYNGTASSWEKGQGRVWSGLYGIIEDCNLNIEGLRGSSLINAGGSQQKTMRRYLGECLTVRAMAYLDLIRLYGDVSLKLESSQADLSNAYLGKTDRDVILDTLMLNLDEAIELLPWAGEVSDYTTERVTRGFADALYAQVALTRAGYAIRESAKAGYETESEYSDAAYPTQRPDAETRNALYEKAVEKLSDIIKSGKHSLNPSFEDEWYLVNQRTLDKSYQENIFEIPMGLSVTGELGYTIGVRVNGATSTYGPKGNSSGKQRTTAMLLYSYDQHDSRRDITCVPYQIKEESGVTKEFALGNTPFELYIGKWDVRNMNEEWRQAALASSDKVMTGINCIRMRYSQVLLLYAEALNELAGPTGHVSNDAGITAKEALAEVHSRAFAEADKSYAESYIASLPTDKDGFFSAIVDENAWELTGEGVRKFDLIRWGLLVKKTNEMKEKYMNEIINVVPEKVYFNYTDAAKTKIDKSSFTWYSTPSNASSYDDSMTGFGKDDMKNSESKNRTNLASISCGLGGVTTDIDGFSAPAVGTVINRNLMPLYTTTVADSNGKLYNSYGW